MSILQSIDNPPTEYRRALGRVSDRFQMTEEQKAAHRQKVRYNRTILHAFYISVAMRLEARKARTQK